MATDCTTASGTDSTHIQGRSRALEQLHFENPYAALPDEFWHAVEPQPLLDTRLLSFSEAAASLIDLDLAQIEREDFIDYFTGHRRLDGMQPLAMCYAGHQFGVYVPRLGDGRAILLGQVRNSVGQLWDIQIKGSGPTRYSRQGDGRAVLRSSIREYLCSEAMAALGIPTTRALCLIGSRQAVYREQPEPGAMLVRLAQSHIRFGSFEYFYYSKQYDHLRRLADYVIQQHYPELSASPRPYVAMLEEVISRTATLMAQWQGVGFAHGVMNSDNMSILGLTLDYGPFGFLDNYEENFICNHSDHHGRYAFGEQPDIALFNLSCLAQAMTPLISDDHDEAVAIARASLEQYPPQFIQAYQSMLHAKLGLADDRGAEDLNLWRQLLALLEGQVDYTRFFRALCHFDSAMTENNSHLRGMFTEPDRFDSWAERYRQRLQQSGQSDNDRRQRMLKVNPKYILRNYLAEQAIRQAEDHGDLSQVERLLQVLRRPFDEQPEAEEYAATAPDWARGIQVSCSS